MGEKNRGCLILTLWYLIWNQRRLEKSRVEGFVASGVDMESLKETLEFAKEMMNKTVNGDLTITGKLTVQGGSDFTGGRHLFEDVENAGKLRVGAAWGNPGIYGENPEKQLAIGSQGGWVQLGPDDPTQGRQHISVGELQVNTNASIKGNLDVDQTVRAKGDVWAHGVLAKNGYHNV